MKNLENGERRMFALRPDSSFAPAALKTFTPNLMPLGILKRLIDRPQFTTSMAGLNFTSDQIRRTAMRGLWKLSAPEYIENFT